MAKYFSIDELTRSDTAAARGIDNTPGAGAAARLAALAERPAGEQRVSVRGFERGGGGRALVATPEGRGGRHHNRIEGGQQAVVRDDRRQPPGVRPADRRAGLVVVACFVARGG